jgi:Lon protease-like protein
MGQQQERIPLFPLGVVLLPRMPLPLHIFEDRYRTMISQCIDSGTQFGVVYTNGTKIEPAGCTASVERVLERYEDGRFDVLTIGQTRFQIHEILDEKSYLEARVSRFQDAMCDHQETLRELSQRAIDKLEEYAGMTGHSIKRTILDRMELEELSFMIGTAGVFTLEDKQRFLQMTSPYERLQTVISLLDKSIERQQMMQQVRQAIGSEDDISPWLN